MPTYTPDRVLRALRQTPVVLKGLLAPLTQEQAVRCTDGPDGWSVLEVMCHLRDYEPLVLRRAHLIVDSDIPALPVFPHLELVKSRDYIHQNLQREFEAYLQERRALLDYLTTLSARQWQRQGVHPEFGVMTMLETGLNTTLHDINHYDQIVRALELSDRLF